MRETRHRETIVRLARSNYDRGLTFGASGNISVRPEDAVYATEGLEETAKLFLLLRDLRTQPLSADQMAALRRRFPNEV